MISDRVRDILAEASIRGLRKIRGKIHDATDGVCAVGALHVAYHNWNLHEARNCYLPDLNPSYVNQQHYTCRENMYAELELFDKDIGMLVNMNDTSTADFLEIARKAQLNEERDNG